MAVKITKLAYTPGRAVVEDLGMIEVSGGVNPSVFGEMFNGLRDKFGGKPEGFLNAVRQEQERMKADALAQAANRGGDHILAYDCTITEMNEGKYLGLFGSGQVVRTLPAK